MRMSDEITSFEIIKAFAWMALVIGIVLFCSLYIKNGETVVSYFSSSWGTLLSGIGTFGIFLLALLRFPTEMEKWRERTREDARLERERMDYQSELSRKDRILERQEIAAATILEAVDRVVDAIAYVTNPFSYGGEGETEEFLEKYKDEDKLFASQKRQKESERFVNMVNSRFKAVSEDLNFFFKSTLQAKIYFEEGIMNDLKGIQEEIKSIRISSHMHSMGLYSDMYGEPTYQKAYEEFYDINKSRKNKLEAIKNSLNTNLKSYLIHKVSS